MNKKRVLLVFIIFVLLIILLYLLFIKFNNKTEKTVKKNVVEKLEKKDNIKPKIKLKGKDNVVLVKNSIYEEMGAIATDNIDNDITDKINIKNNIDLNVAGNYKVKYSVRDSSNNESSIERNVKIIEVENPDNDGISVLMYHYFYDDTIGEIGKDTNYISKTNFESQLKYLKDNDYYFPSMKEISLYVDGKLELPEKSVVITMDDGHADNYSIAYPLALKYKVPIVMFVVTSWTNVHDTLQQEMIDTGYVNMQSHTHDMHRSGCSGMGHGGIIMCIDYQEGLNDLKKSKEELNNSDSLAYPFGDNNEKAQQMLKEAGFSLGFTTEYGKIRKGMNKLSLPRVRINGNISLDSFASSL